MEAKSNKIESKWNKMEAKSNKMEAKSNRFFIKNFRGVPLGNQVLIMPISPRKSAPEAPPKIQKKT